MPFPLFKKPPERMGTASEWVLDVSEEDQLICIALICLCVPILLCFPEQLSHLPYMFWHWRN